MTRLRLRAVLLIALFSVVAPAVAVAQESAIAGIVKDGSGGVLPGVTVEAASDALIERSRTVVTDALGQYKIINLVPGAYIVTFTLPGFRTHRRDGIDLTSNFTAQINADMAVGEVQEIVSVTSSAPVVDVQNVQQRVTFTREEMDALPTGRHPGAFAALIPGVALYGGVSDIGGSLAIVQTPVTYRGGNMVQGVEGMRQNNMSSVGEFSEIYWNDGMFQEITYVTGADSAEIANNGIRINMIPRDGGNRFRGTVYANYTGPSWNADNLSDELKARGLTQTTKIRRIYDFNPTFGGPIRRDRLWFQATFRHQGVDKTSIESFPNISGVPNRYVADRTQPGIDGGDVTSTALRLTAQLNPRHKLTSYFDKQGKTRTAVGIAAFIAPEATAIQETPNKYAGNVNWTWTISSRLVAEAGWATYRERSDFLYQPEVTPTTYAIQEQSSGQWYNAYNPGESLQTHEQDTYKAKLSFVTGSHDFRVGIDLATGLRRLVNRRTGFLTMRQNGGVFNRITMFLPLDRTERLNADGGAYVNDKWTLKRATVTAGLRYEWYRSEALPSSVLPNPWSPAATFEGVEKVPDWKDLQPRLGLSYDLFGNGKTALKASVSRYSDPATLWWVGGATGFAGYPGAAPVLRLVNTEDRPWTDLNGDNTVFNPDGSVQDSEFNPRYPDNMSEIGAAPSGSIFGQLRPQATIIDPGPNEGWFKRQYNWEFAGTLQHELMNRVAASLTYWRRTRAGNEPSVDNINIGPADFEGPFCVKAPSDPRLPNGGGFDVCGLYDLSAAARLRPIQNKLTHIKDHAEGADIKDYYHGVEMTMNARLGRGTFLQGGLSMQRIVFSLCEYLPLLDSPEALRVNAVTGRPQCDTTQPFRPNAKFSGAYQLPWYGIQLSGTYQWVAGPGIFATWTFGNELIAPALGRPTSDPTGFKTVALMQTGQGFSDALNQVDFRVTKRIGLPQSRAIRLMADLYNALNSSWVTGQNNTFGTTSATNTSAAATWLRPTGVINGRMFKMGVQIDF